MKAVTRGPHKTSCCKKCNILCFLTVNVSTESQLLATLQFIQSNVLHQYTWTIRVEAVSSFETSAIYQPPRRHITENLTISTTLWQFQISPNKTFITHTDVTDGNLEHSSKLSTFPTVAEITKKVV